MYDDYSDFDEETIEVMVIHDEDEIPSNSASNSHPNRLLTYEEVCELLNNEKKTRNKYYMNFGYKGRLARDILLIVLMVILYVFTNPFTNIESSDPIWKMILSMIGFTVSLIGFYFSFKTFKKDYRIYNLNRHKEWLEKYYR